MNQKTKRKKIYRNKMQPFKIIFMCNVQRIIQHNSIVFIFIHIVLIKSYASTYFSSFFSFLFLFLYFVRITWDQDQKFFEAAKMWWRKIAFINKNKVQEKNTYSIFVRADVVHALLFCIWTKYNIWL